MLLILTFAVGVQAGTPPGAGAIERDQLSVRDAWVAEALPGSSNSAAYMVIVNGGDVDEELLSVDSEVAENIELHKMENRDGMMRMQKVDYIMIAPGTEVKLEPGGLHVMLIGLERQLSPGEDVEITLVFEDGSRSILTAPVKKVEVQMEHDKHH
jgi:copper(I)-binding protein